jgi:Tfp pilus assembly ATPase PilU
MCPILVITLHIDTENSVDRILSFYPHYQQNLVGMMQRLKTTYFNDIHNQNINILKVKAKPQI